MNKDEFTFVMLTYNQEKYVIEQMESIKYQIMHYGKNYSVYFLLCDDASIDHTVDYVEKWLAEETLFAEKKVIKASVNQGIVKNYITALKNIQTEQFKMLGGDDLFYKYNVFEAAKKSDFTITPVLYLSGMTVTMQLNWAIKRYLIRKNHMKRLVQTDYKYLYIFYTPGVFWNHRFAKKSLYRELSQYKWCEDLICWNYLLNLQEIKVDMLARPYVIYRINCGISTNENHRFNVDLEKEAKEIHKKVFINRFKFPKIINPYRYLFKIKGLFYTYFVFKLSNHIKIFEREMDKEEIDARDFYSEIHKTSLKWLADHGGEQISM